MSTIASLLALADPNIKPWHESMQGVAQSETSLIKLADLKRQQAAEAAMMERIQKDPEVARQLFGGGPILGSLMQPQGQAGGAPGGAPPAPGAITQSPLGGGPSQQIPAYPDASRYANVPPQSGGPIPPGMAQQLQPQVTPPQSILGSLGPAGQPQPQAPRNPLLEMARTDPRAAMMLQQQMEQRQDANMKRQEQRLKMGSAMMGSLGQMAQGVTDQAGWDQMRQDAAQIDPQLAARLPQVYSKEAKERVVTQALDVKEALTLQVQDLTAQAAVIKARKEGRATDVDNQLRAMGVQPGQETPAQMKEALQAVEDAKVRVSASHGTGQIVKGPTGEYIRIRPGTNDVEVIRGPSGEPLREKPSETEQKGATLANSVAAANKLATELEDKGYKPSIGEKALDKLPLGLGNYLTSSDYQKYRQTVREFASAWLYGVSGAQITDSEWENANQTFFPQPNENKAAVALKRERRAELVKQLQQQSAATGRTGTQAPPTSQGSTGTGKPVTGMSRQEIADEIAAIKKRGGS